MADWLTNTMLGHEALAVRPYLGMTEMPPLRSSTAYLI
jgi:hypothetical protein